MEADSTTLIASLLKTPRVDPTLADKQVRLLRKISSDSSSKPPADSNASLMPAAMPPQPLDSSGPTML